MKTHPIPTLTGKDIARFLAKIAPANERGCRLWTAAKIEGYGNFSLGGRPSSGGRTVLAHRVAYTLWVGPIPDGLEIDHRCHNHACCTPEHLRPATRKQNQENREGNQSNSQSGVRGVSPCTRNGKTRWNARVVHHGQVHVLGRFDTIAEAEAVVVAERARLFTHNDADRQGG